MHAATASKSLNAFATKYGFLAIDIDPPVNGARASLCDVPGEFDVSSTTNICQTSKETREADRAMGTTFTWENGKAKKKIGDKEKEIEGDRTFLSYTWVLGIKYCLLGGYSRRINIEGKIMAF